MEEQELTEVLQLRQAVTIELTSDQDVLRRFRAPQSKMISRDEGSQKATNATCTAFCLYYLAVSDLLPRPSVRKRLAALPLDEAAETISKLGEELVRQHSRPVRNNVSTAIGVLPNQYNSAIQVAGYLASTRLLGLPIPPVVQMKCGAISQWLAWKFLKKPMRGWVPRIENSAIPSAYLTFWTAAALREWGLTQYCSARNRQLIDLTLEEVAKWSEQEITNAIAYHYSGFRSRIDVVELAYAILCGKASELASSAAELSKRAVGILFSSYFDHGCFSPSAPVLADKHNFSLQCPTAEVVSLLVNSRREILYDQWRHLCTIYDWLRDNRVSNRGWVPESLGRNGPPTAFMTASSLAFLSGLSRLLDDTMHRGSSAILSVPRLPPVPPRGYTYPGKLPQILHSHVIQPLTADPRKDEIASYSMILYGPPGTSKTTVARKLAADLGWPLLIINQNAFLQKGVVNIDAEAERLFRLVGYLKDVVVLFDEVEELVEERSTSDDKVSRILTTSMLPRIHYLRDLHRIVFIFATNRLESIDNAASRLGRFDIVQGVAPPTKAEREHILREILNDLGVERSLGKAFEDANVAKTAENFCYIDLYALVRQVKIEYEIDQRPVTSDFIGDVQRIYARRVLHSDFTKAVEKVEENSKKVDRP